MVQPLGERQQRSCNVRLISKIEEPATTASGVLLADPYANVQNAAREVPKLVSELMEQKSAHRSALESFESVAGLLELSTDIRAALASTEAAAQVDVPVAMDDGHIRYFEGFHVRHNTSRGPAHTAIRYQPTLTLEDVKALAMWMTWRWAVLDIPFGGGMGAIAVDPQKLSNGEMERLTRGYHVQIAPAIDPERDILIPEKPAGVGEGWGEATGHGVFCAAKAACDHVGMPIKHAHVVVLGFGNVGSAAALRMVAAGSIVTGAGDSRGAIYDAGGLDIPKLILHKQRSGSVVGFPGSVPITDCELLGLECDVLICSALQNAIHGQCAPGVRARIVAEATNGPLTQKADEILEAKGVLVIPDLLCGAGGLALSYLEGPTRRCLSEKNDVYCGIEGIMHRSFCELLALSLEHKVSLRKAAHLLAVSRVAKRMR